MTIYGNFQFILLKNDQQYPQSIVIKCMKCVMKCLKVINDCEHCNKGKHLHRNIELQQVHSVKSSKNFFTERNTSVLYRITQFLKDDNQKEITGQNGTPSSIRSPNEQHISFRSFLPFGNMSNVSSVVSSPTTEGFQDEWLQSYEASKMDRLSSRLRSMEDEKKSFLQMIQRLQSENSQLTLQNESLQLASEELAKIKQLEMEKLALSQELERLRIQLDEDKRHFYDSKLEAETLRDELDSTRKRLEAELQRTNNLSQELKNMSYNMSREANSGPVPSIESSERIAITKRIRDIEHRQFVLMRRKDLISLINQKIFSRKSSQSIHQGFCALLCLGMDFHNELWRDTDPSLMQNHINLVYEQIAKTVDNYNGYISHFSMNEEFIISFNSVYDCTEFTLQLLEDLLHLSSNEAFENLKYTPTVVHSMNKSLLLFKGARYRAYIHADYSQVKSNAISVRDSVSDFMSRILHDVHSGDAIAKLQYICRTQTMGGILAMSPEAWQEISHLSLETSFTKSPIQIYVDSTLSHFSTITYVYPKNHSERLAHAIGYAEKRIDVDLNRALSLTESELQQANQNLKSMDQFERNGHSMMKAELNDSINEKIIHLVSKFEDPFVLWSKLKQELDTYVELLIQQTREVADMEAQSTPSTPSKAAALRELRMQLDRTRLRHQHVKDFMQSITNQQEQISKAKARCEELEREMRQYIEKNNIFELKIREKDAVIMNQTAEFQRLKVEIKGLIEKILFSHASGASAEERNLLQKLETFVRTGETYFVDTSSLSEVGSVASRNKKADSVKISKLRTQLEKCRDRCEHLKEEVQSYEYRLKQATTLNEKLTSTNEKLTASKKAAANKLEVSEKKVTFLEHQIRKKNEEIDILKRKVETLKENHEKLENKRRESHPVMQYSFRNTTLPQLARTPVPPITPMTPLTPMSPRDHLSFQKRGNNIFSFQNEFQTVVYMESQIYGTILSSTYWTSGEHRFTIQLDRATENMLIGVADVFHSIDKRIGETDKSWGLSINTGSIFHAGGWKRFANRRIDSYVVVNLDLRRANEGKGTISFVIDGLDFGIAAANLKGAICPSVSFFHRGDQVTIM